MTTCEKHNNHAFMKVFTMSILIILNFNNHLLVLTAWKTRSWGPSQYKDVVLPV